MDNNKGDMIDESKYNDVLGAMNRRYQLKKIANIRISILIVILGVSSFIFGLRLEPSVTIFRFMTVDGTVFTTISAFLAVIANIVELKNNTEDTSRFVYFSRLSSAVVETVIFIVVAFSQLPFFTEHIPIFDRYDSLVMHVFIPILGSSSFVINDSPIGRLSPEERLYGTWFVTFYAVVVFLLIGSGLLPTELIPYFFLDVVHNSWWIPVIAFALIYGVAYFMSWWISELNRHLSWLWFYKVTEE